MIALLTIAIGALCLIGGFVLVIRAIGKPNSKTTIKIPNLVEFQLEGVGPGILFALFGVVLIGFNFTGGLGNREASNNQSIVVDPATPAPKPTEASPVPAPTDTPTPGPAPPSPQPGPVAQICVSVIVGQTGQDLSIQRQCGLTPAQARVLAVQNVNFILAQFDAIQDAKTTWLFPRLNQYRANPTPGNWAIVAENSRSLLKSVRAAAAAIMQLDRQSSQAFGPEIIELARILMERTSSFTSIDLYGVSGPQGSEIDAFKNEQATLYTDCQVALNQIRRRLTS